MKPTPNTSDEHMEFRKVLRQVLTVSKAELDRRVAADNASRADKPRRGPKPRSSASVRASSEKG